jgi:hypothetical protein
MRHTIEFLWFSDCPNHATTRELLAAAVDRLVPGTPIFDIDATDPSVATGLRFPGSPTIRVDGVDIEPGFVDPGDYTPRCRLYRTSAGLRGIPDPAWIEDAFR